MNEDDMCSYSVGPQRHRPDLLKFDNQVFLTDTDEYMQEGN